jgi:hypothetical protein
MGAGYGGSRLKVRHRPNYRYIKLRLGGGICWRSNIWFFVGFQGAGDGIFFFDPIAQINEAAAIGTEWK